MARRKKSVSVNMSSEHRKNIARCIEFIGYRHNKWNVFSDFLAIAAITLSNNSDPYHIVTSEKVYAEREKRYLEIIKKYDKREQKFLVSMFAELIEEMQSYCADKESMHLTDVLGELFHELNFNDAWKGQFFTPQLFCDMMGEIVIGGGDICKKSIAEKGYFTANEPC